MQLADYALPGANPDLAEPLASRLLKLLDYFGGRVMILSGRRSRAEQQALWDAYLAGTGNLAARPGTSNHELGLAADLERYDSALSWGEVHYTAAAFGLKFPIPSENRHCEAAPDWVEPPEEFEMNDADMQKLAGYIAAALDARQRSVHSYRDGGQYNVDAKTLEEYTFAEQQQAALAAQGVAPKA